MYKKQLLGNENIIITTILSKSSDPTSINVKLTETWHKKSLFFAMSTFKLYKYLTIDRCLNKVQNLHLD